MNDDKTTHPGLGVGETPPTAMGQGSRAAGTPARLKVKRPQVPGQWDESTNSLTWTDSDVEKDVGGAVTSPERGRLGQAASRLSSVGGNGLLERGFQLVQGFGGHRDLLDPSEERIRDAAPGRHLPGHAPIPVRQRPARGGDPTGDQTAEGAGAELEPSRPSRRPQADKDDQPQTQVSHHADPQQRGQAATRHLARPGGPWRSQPMCPHCLVRVARPAVFTNKANVPRCQ